MALRNKGMVRSFSGTANRTITARSGESLLITAVRGIEWGQAFVSFFTDKTKVAAFAQTGALGGHLSSPSSHDPFQTALGYPTLSGPSGGGAVGNLLDLMRDRGVLLGFPVAEGQTFLMPGTFSATGFCSVMYDEYDAGDQLSAMPNGSDSKEYVFVSYGRPASAPTGGGDVHITAAQSGAEFPQFPWSGPVPANHRMTVLGILASDWTKVDAAVANFWSTRYLKLVRDREVLFDLERNGLPLHGWNDSVIVSQSVVGSGDSVTGSYSVSDRRKPLMLDPPLVFEAGQELDVYVNYAVGGAPPAVAVAEMQVGLIFKVERL